MSSYLGNSQKVSTDIISNVENALCEALPQVSLPSTTDPWLFRGHSHPCFSPVPGTLTLCSFENLIYSRAPPFGMHGLSGALPAVPSEALHNPSILRGASHDNNLNVQVPIFQLTRQWQPLVSLNDSSYMKRDDSSDGRPKNRPDNLSETLFTVMPSVVSPIATSNQGAQGLLETQAKVSVLLANDNYHSV